MRVLLIGSLSCILPFLIALPTSAQGIEEEWPYAKLFDKSTLVVVAKLKSAKKVPKKMSKAFPRRIYDAIEVTFHAEAILKGAIKKTQEFRVLHLDYRSDLRTIPGGVGDRLSFDHKGMKLGVDGAGKPVFGPKPLYLLFLKKGDKGRFIPVSGQRFPAHSARLLAPATKATVLTRSKN